MTTATPAQVSSGRVVRIAGRRFSWQSPLLEPDDAAALAIDVRHLLAQIGDGPGMFAFECGDGRLVDIRAREVVALELVTTCGAPRGDRRPSLGAMTPEQVADTVVQQ